MKTHSVLIKICALISALSISMFSGCESSSSGTGSETSESPITSETPESPETSETPETPETSETHEPPETSETPETPGTSETPNENALTITAPVGEVYSYVDEAKKYLLAGEGADVVDYAEQMDNPQAPIQIKWKFEATGARKFRVEYATKADYSDAISEEVGATKRSLDVYNLYKATTYYLRISALNSKGEAIETQESEFYTTDYGPRVMNIEGICNVRDLGGFQTSFGKRIVQGIAYRGGALKDGNSRLANGNYLEITEDGKKYMSEVMGIKGELDFRTENESGIKLENGSLIPGATLTYITIGGYDDIFKGEVGTGQKETYRQVFSYLSNKDNYPLYYHCTAGADRTGTVSYILHAFLGVSELECGQDYEFTSFSIYGTRGGSTGVNTDRYKEMKRLLNEYEGDNLQEKTENYLLSIGVTETELNNIKAIFFGEVDIDGKGFTPENETSNVPEEESKTLSQQYSEILAAWTIQRKEI